MEVDLDWLCRLVSRHCPAFFLHPSDRYMPCSVEFFMLHSELRAAVPSPGPGGSEGTDVATLLPHGAVAGPLLLEAQRQRLPGSQLWLQLDPAARTGEPLDRIDQVPVYAYPKHVVGPDGGVEAIEILYMTLYAYNGAYKVAGLPFIQTGSHDGDWEHLSVRLHPTTGELQGVWYNAHRSRDGCWVPSSEVPRCPLTRRIAAFVALHGHGVYPAPGRVLRHFFCGNDLCSQEGPAWRPQKVVLLPQLEDLRAATAGGTGGSAAPPAAPRRRLVQVPSRGCLLPGAPNGQAAGGSKGSSSTYDDAGSSAAGSGSDGTGTGGSGAGSGAGVSSDGAFPQVLTEECCAWVLFEGQWGTTDAPAMQGWFHAAETPVSRSALLRVVGHLWPECQSVVAPTL